MFLCDIVDQAVATRILEVGKSEQIEIALKAQEEFERRNKAVDNQ